MVGIAVAIGIMMFRDNAVDQNRSAVIADPRTMAEEGIVGWIYGGCPGIGLASTAFTNTTNGGYIIKTAGTATTLVLEGVGNAALRKGTFCTYDMTITS